MRTVCFKGSDKCLIYNLRILWLWSVVACDEPVRNSEWYVDEGWLYLQCFSIIF